MAAVSVSRLAVLITILSYSLSIKGSDGGSVGNYYRMELIRRESALSPLMKPLNLTTAQRVRLSLERSRRRLQRLQAMSRGDNLYSPVIPNDGEFLMQLGVGSPSPLLQHVLLDTGSDLVWLQCGPNCSICYQQNDTLYNPNASSTYKNLSCTSTFCTGSVKNFCNHPSDTCGYFYAYGDGGNTTGDMATETFSLKRMGSDSSGWEALPPLAFGCGHRQEGNPVAGGSGLVGLGRGVLSLVSQLGEKINSTFSYCLGPIDDHADAGYLILGDAPLPGNLQSTPLLRRNGPNYITSSFYYLDLQGISVGGTMIKYPASAFQSGGLIIDSGSTMTSLVDPAYESLLAAVKSSIKAQPVIDDRLCYESSKVALSTLPQIAFHFAGNASFVMPPRNSFHPAEDNLGHQLQCFAYNSSGGERSTSVFGNTQQQNFNIVYDLVKNTLSFAPAVCDNL